ncbi:unnamed protein product [Mytilus coruscus]|uniref:Phytanoyl-CoA dioxygenase n=1 Tax=Mytilus coruscus TaxID=42192 RepID=A0A6J8CF70_MYTCO|nr:unnamed protein product [Mytilus coruscus]
MQVKGNPMQFNRDAVINSLEDNGYAVIPNVLSIQECDTYIKEYKDWAKQVEDTGIPFTSFESLIQGYSIGNKLYAKPNQDWLHIDQGGHRIGLHAFQGAVYLEEACETDHCFRVLAKSHKEHENFMKIFPHVGPETRDIEFYKLDEKEIKWYIEERGCKLTKVPAPKGGIILWDSRTVHDNSRPEFGRPNQDRWRHIVFVCMTPAAWATQGDLAKKHESYKNLLMTSHWPSVGVGLFPCSPSQKTPTITELPEIAKTKEAKMLMGIEPYDFEDGTPNGPRNPEIKL